MDYQYQIDKEALTESVIQEISKVASVTYTPEGVSMYDTVMPVSSDRPTLDNALDSAVTTIVTRFIDVATPEEESIGFTLPDIIEENKTKATETLNRYIVESVVAEWMIRRLPNKAEEYAKKAEFSIKRAASLLKTRDTPKRK